ncbi:MAG TPA: ATP-binding protein [Flavisolibacter sp.]|nr:ATP-binding protein [Flavisolibacter sp.]
MIEEPGSKVKDEVRTNWYVITGGPGCGKTTMVNMLHQRGYQTAIEHARHYIDTMRVKGKTVEEIRKNQIEFQSAILEMQMAEEASHKPGDTIFFDRAIPDARAYYRFLHLPEDDRLKEALKSVAYKKIFILDPLPIVNDYARIEDGEAQQKIHALITEVYTSLGFNIVRVPVLPPGERVNFILQHL